jgi:hypothetical protein
MKDAFWFPHDANARNDPAICEMRAKFGSQGYGWFWVLVEMMREQGDYKLMHARCNGYAMQMQCPSTKAAAFIAHCIELGLFKSDGVAFWSDRLMREMEYKEQNQQRRSEHARTAANAKWKKRDNADALPEQCPSNADAMPKNATEHNNTIQDSTEQDIYTPPTPPKGETEQRFNVTKAVDEWDMPEKVKNAMRDFIQFRRSKSAPLSKLWWTRATKKLAGLAGTDCDMMVAIIDQSIECNWDGLFQVKEGRQKQVEQPNAYDGYRRIGT